MKAACAGGAWIEASTTVIGREWMGAL